jgi:hypothetical protein
MREGSCLCGAVRYTVDAEFTGANACHCSQCRRQSGHYWAAGDVPKTALTLTAAEGLRWYQASDIARRGFCTECGSFLFWERLDGDDIAVALGTVAGATGTRLEGHIFVADKGDYYDIADGLPQEP